MSCIFPPCLAQERFWYTTTDYILANSLRYDIACLLALVGRLLTNVQVRPINVVGGRHPQRP